MVTPSRTSHPTESTLRICLSGQITVEWQGIPLRIPRRTVRGLLYCLAADIQPVSRQRLISLLWPETPELKARQNLSHLLTHLQNALLIPEILLVEQDQIALNPDLIWCDIREIKAASADLSKNNHAKKGSSISSRAALERIIQLYRGPFLFNSLLPKCTEYEAWADQERRFLEIIYLDALKALIDICKLGCEFQKAISYASQYLATDDMAEHIHRQLIELYGLIGDRLAAQKQYEICLKILERELGVKPLTETQAAYQIALGIAPSSVHNLYRSVPIRAIPEINPFFVGRETALIILKRALDSVSEGQGQFVLINGEPGIGKTRLLNEFAVSLDNQTLWLCGACHPGSRVLPYQPLADAIHQIIDIPRIFDKLDPAWLAEAARLLPELRTHYRNLPAPLPLQAEEARTRLFDALAQIIKTLASGTKTVVLSLDNLHWADDTSLHFLSHLAYHMTQEPGWRILVLMTCRAEAGSRLVSLIEALDHSQLAIKIHLDGLTNTDVARLVKSVFDVQDVDPELVARIQKLTGGNPFFLHSILEEFVEAGLCPQTPGDLDRFPIPDSARKAVASRLAHLEAGDKQMIETASVLARAFQPSLIQQVSGRRELDALESLERLSRSHLLDEQNGSFAFHHDLVRSVVYDDIGIWRKRLLHRRAGEALEKCAPGEYANLAWHFEQAQEVCKAAAFLIQAGIQSNHVFASDEALKFFDHALELLSSQPNDLENPKVSEENCRLQLQALANRSRLHRLQGHMQDYEIDLQKQLELAEKSLDPGAICTVLLLQTNLEQFRCCYDQAILTAEKALSIAIGLGSDLMQGRAQRDIGLAHRSLGNNDQAQQALEQALSLFFQCGEAGYQIHTLCNLSTLAANQEKYTQALRLADQALLLCETANLPYHRRVPLADKGVALAGLGEKENARLALLASLDIARQIFDRTQEIYCLIHLGELAYKDGQPSDAMNYYLLAQSLAERLESRAEQSCIHNGISMAYLQLGHLDSALEHASQAFEIADICNNARDKEQANQIIETLQKRNQLQGQTISDL